MYSGDFGTCSSEEGTFVFKQNSGGHFPYPLLSICPAVVVVKVLMRALRDFNVPKIVVDDTPVFMGLIGDLFPALDVPRKRDLEFEKHIKKATLDASLQPEDNFILKVTLIHINI